MEIDCRIRKQSEEMFIQNAEKKTDKSNRLENLKWRMNLKRAFIEQE